MSIPYALGLLFLAVVTASGQECPPAPISSARQIEKPSDAGLQQAIEARLAASKIAADRFQVHVRGSVAVLEGRTGVAQHKGTATRLAKLAGATKVDNRIEVTQRARDKASKHPRSQRSSQARSAPRRVRVQWPDPAPR